MSVTDPAPELARSALAAFDYVVQAAGDFRSRAGQRLMAQQVASTRLVLTHEMPVRRIFVDGGFSKNPIYMNLLASQFPDMEVFAASVAQATAVGAALAIHNHWNRHPVPSNLIDLKYYTH